MASIKKILSSKYMVIIVWTLVLMSFWEIGATVVQFTKRIPEYTMPHFYQIIGAIFDTKKVSGGQTALQLVLTGAGATLSKAFLGFLIGTVLGYILALLMNLSKIVEKIAFPYLMVIQMIPILGMAPIIFSITKDVNTSRLLIAVILTFYPVAANVLAGFRAIETEKLDLMYISAASKMQFYTKTLIPSSLPYFFTGLKISAPMAITAAILVDTLQGAEGLGVAMTQSLKHGISIYVFWLVILLAIVISLLTYMIMNMLEKLFMPHKRKKRLGNQVKEI